MAHPIHNIRASASDRLKDRHIVLAVSGSIAAVKCVELARELIRHGAHVTAVMSSAATRIIHPDAMHFATGRAPIVHLSGAVEHVALLGDVPEKADLLLVAPATANTVAKMALGIDDTPVTTCASVAFGTGTPVVVAPAMHDAMLRHPRIQRHVESLQKQRGVHWVEPRQEENKAKLADVDAIVEQCMSALCDGAMRGRHVLVIGGATAEAVDDVRILTNRSSGRSAYALATALRRRGADVTIWMGHATVPAPPGVEPIPFTGHAQLMEMAGSLSDGAFDQVWMPAAISDYVPERLPGKLPSGQDDVSIRLRSVGKVAEAIRKRMPKARLVAFKAEARGTSDKDLEEAARDRLQRYKATHVFANTADAFGATTTRLLVVSPSGATWLEGPKERVLDQAVDAVVRSGS